MTKADKAELRALCRVGDKRSDERLAALCDCTVATVKKYRRVCGPKPAPILDVDEILSARK